MLVTEVTAADRAAVGSEVDRLTTSSLLHGSEALCRLLRFLAEHFLAHPGGAIKEYQLATEVFGRPADFDPRLDSTVRVQTGRLRSKLAEYYAGAGNNDPIVLEIPKGSYSLSFHYREKLPLPIEIPPPVPEAIPARSASSSEANRIRNLIGGVWILGLLCAMSLGILGYQIYRERPEPRLAAHGEQLPDIERRFWSPFALTDDRPWVIFSNAEFVGHPLHGIRYFDPARDARSQILDHYTGVGEVLAVAELSRIFSSLRHPIRIKRGLLLALDDVKNNDVIFIGSPAENLTLREFATTQDFVFKRIETPERKGDVEIFNLHPRNGEPASFRANRTLPITQDYGLIAMVPGINPSRTVLLLAGTTTMGTQAAAEFVSREDSLQTLVNQLPNHAGSFGPFEAVIDVKISGGVPVKSTLVALHTPLR